jgi:hypothetical protein
MNFDGDAVESRLVMPVLPSAERLTGNSRGLPLAAGNLTGVDPATL